MIFGGEATRHTISRHPAKAGVQGDPHDLWLWIPASAGMTVQFAAATL